MDILQLIREKIERIKELSQDDHLGLEAVVTHIEIAEKYLFRAKQENDENLFTDVIYRTNHAFEGILKEAYSILTGEDASRYTPFQIERYLSENEIFRPRVMELFRNYRTEWRNPSTHDHKLFFSEQEAFLAIISVSSFINILLDQIIEQINFGAEQAKVQDRVDTIRASIPNYDTLPLLERLKRLLVAFVDEGDWEYRNEREIIGLIAGFIASVDPTIIIQRDKRFRLGNVVLETDMVLSAESEQVIVEVKTATPGLGRMARAQQQLVTFMVGSGITDGILYFVPKEPGGSMATEDLQVKVGKERLNIVKIFPHKQQTG